MTTSLVAPASATAGDAFTTVDQLERGLRDQRYVAERGLATTLFLTLKLGKSLLLEGEAGVGKTEIAKVLADVLTRFAPLVYGIAGAALVFAYIVQAVPWNGKS